MCPGKSTRGCQNGEQFMKNKITVVIVETRGGGGSHGVQFRTQGIAIILVGGSFPGGQKS